MADYRSEMLNALDKLCDRVCVYSKKQRGSMCRACPLGAAFDMVDELPAADVAEVIRCKDCRHYGWTENRIPSEREWWCYKWDDAREETDFCSHAERRKDER